MFDAVCFDFFGTVVESDERAVSEIAAEVVRRATRPTTSGEVIGAWWTEFCEQCAVAHGPAFRRQEEIGRSSLRTIVKQLGLGCDVDELISSQFAYQRAPDLVPGAAALLKAMRLPIAIISNVDAAPLEDALTYTSLTPDVVVTSESARSYKPRPEPFEEALRGLGSEAARTLHVGDSIVSDVVGASELGIPVAWVNRRHQPPGPAPERWLDVDDLEELHDALAELGLADPREPASG